MTGPLLPTGGEWAAIGAELALAGLLVAVLVVPFFVRVAADRAVAWTALAGLALAFGLTYVPSPSGPVLAGMLTNDPAAVLWRRVLLAFTAGVVCLWMASGTRTVPRGDGPEFFTLLVSATLGLSLMGATSNLLMLLLATELASMPSYVLAGFRKTGRHAAEASLKYVLFGAVCTAAMIYGLSLLYGLTGSLDFRTVAQSAGDRPLLAIGLLLVLVGILFKLAAVPAQFWCPDVFEGASVEVAAFLSVASKGAGVALLARLFVGLGGNAAATTLAVVAVVTTTFGNLGALRQRSVKRLLAYSSIAHAGYLLSAIVALPGGLSAVWVYVVVYAAMNLGAFAVLAAVEGATGTDDASAFDGLSSRAPLAAAAMTVCLVAMVGLPPTAGFWAKLLVLNQLTHLGGWAWVLVASVALNSVLSLAYYARLLRAMYLRPARNDSSLPALAVGVGTAAAAALLLAFVLFGTLNSWTAATFWSPSAQTP